MALGKSRGYQNTWLWRPKTMARLCSKALEVGIEVEYLQELIIKRRLIPEKPSWELEKWPWPIRITTLGKFDLIRDGSPLKFGTKIPKKPLTLLKALIALGGQDVPQHMILDYLWPDLDGDAANRAFKVCLHRLRKMLGYDDVVSNIGEKLTLNHKFCWVDVWRFIKVLNAAETNWLAANDENKHSEAVRLTEQIIAENKGSFLAGDHASWAIGLREQLNARQHICIRSLAGHYENLNQWEKAITCYQYGIGIDPLLEDFYQRLMRCYHRLDARNQIIRTYNLCRNNLSKFAGLNPSGETTSFFQSLI